MTTITVMPKVFKIFKKKAIITLKEKIITIVARTSRKNNAASSN